MASTEMERLQILLSERNKEVISLNVEVEQTYAALAERDAALEYANMRIDNQMTFLVQRDAEIKELVSTLEEILVYVNGIDITYPGTSAFQLWYAVLAKHAKEPA